MGDSGRPFCSLDLVCRLCLWPAARGFRAKTASEGISRTAPASRPRKSNWTSSARLIARSQRNFKELIDSLDDAALAISLDGTLRTVNRRVTEILGVPYPQMVDHKLEEFLAAPLRTEGAAPSHGFWRSETGRESWRCASRTIRVPGYFDCVVNAIVKGDDVTGASVLARDITGQREKEHRFTDLFETLQEGVYISKPEGQVARRKSGAGFDTGIWKQGRIVESGARETQRQSER